MVACGVLAAGDAPDERRENEAESGVEPTLLSGWPSDERRDVS